MDDLVMVWQLRPTIADTTRDALQVAVGRGVEMNSLYGDDDARWSSSVGNEWHASDTAVDSHSVPLCPVCVHASSTLEHKTIC